MKIYSSLAEWWPLLSPPAEYSVEAEHHWRLLRSHARRGIQTLLELGCGGGNNAAHLRHRCRLTLTDVSPQMLAVSRARNPGCEHVEGDMRTLRLLDEAGNSRAFDAVLVHDGIMYMTTESALRDAMTTAFVHLAPGGAALFVPDCTRETWSSGTGHGGHDGDGRGLRFVDWTYDPDPADTHYTVDIAFLLRDRDRVTRVEHDRHCLGFFPVQTWLDLLRSVGFQPHVLGCDYPGGESARSFVGVRPEAVSADRGGRLGR